MESEVIQARIMVTLKNGVLDPQGKAIEHALDGLGYGEVGSVRQGKVFDVTLETVDRTKAEATLKEICERLLANTVIEDYMIEIAGS
ncbi:phosphoribosylformylglycinamidine synthase subunit PurS [Chelativorans sp. M5D2P16]|uniref:phosphoribosylformylglycinamidine synthase subunit PurS n=1 Tax=Chelativorans sp. M5D2P16 TaxID=3095678 RepID=UPI002ACA3483|nr:phosphoribosylformylglycinamidine synthase subunit PurS [Chelativorans sp. M5D2P16]MDZ5696974.1 phosphoribosylformylglycinamidine synthase subunit PurS [Chelativorans sp. M5D2P16]